MQLIKKKKMNFSDDLLNYELGDDIDDQDELIANEDELLLSDEGMWSCGAF